MPLLCCLFLLEVGEKQGGNLVPATAMQVNLVSPRGQAISIHLCDLSKAGGASNLCILKDRDVMDATELLSEGLRYEMPPSSACSSYYPRGKVVLSQPNSCLEAKNDLSYQTSMLEASSALGVQSRHSSVSLQLWLHSQGLPTVKSNRAFNSPQISDPCPHLICHEIYPLSVQLFVLFCLEFQDFI